MSEILSPPGRLFASQHCGKRPIVLQGAEITPERFHGIPGPSTVESREETRRLHLQRLVSYPDQVVALPSDWREKSPEGITGT